MQMKVWWLIPVLMLQVGIYSPSVFSQTQNDSTVREGRLVGGWYPIFFDAYSEKKMGLLMEKIKEGQVARLSVSYNQNKTLAERIAKEIKSQTSMPLEMKKENLVDGNISYHHYRVVVVVYSK